MDTPDKPNAMQESSYAQGRRAVGHPVDVASGAFFCAWQDVVIGGHAPLVLRRYFSTVLASESLAWMGSGWTHNFAINLSLTPEGYRLRDQNGGAVDFPSHGDPPSDPIFNEAASMELRAEGDMLCVYHWHDWRTAVEKLWFRRLPAGQFRLERISPPSGIGLVLDYDSAGRLSSVTQMIERRCIRFRYNERGLISELLVASPFTGARLFAAYLYDSLGRLSEVRDANSVPIRYRYDKENRMLSEETRSGAMFEMLYDGKGRCVSTRGTDGYHACRLQYALDGRLTLVTNSLGKMSAYEFNATGQVVKETRPDGAVLSTVYDEVGRIVEEIDPLGRSTKYHYDAQSDTALIVYPGGLRMQASYDLNHQPTLLQHGQSVWRFAYANGQLVRVIDPRRVERRYAYDTTGFLSAMVEPTGNTVRIVPDDDWSRIRVLDDYGLDREETYDDLMHTTQRTEPDGGIFQFDFDVRGMLVRATGPDSPPREYRYDAGGNLASTTDGDGYTLLLHNTVHGLLDHLVTPSGRTYRCVWDDEGRLKAWVNAAGERAEFKHDDAGREIEVRHFDGRVESTEFDLAGRVIKRRRADGTVIGFDYDIADNLVRVHSGGADLIVSEYDTESRLLRTMTPDADVSFEYESGLWIAAETQNGRRIEYRYNDIGALVSRGFSDSPLPPLEFEWDKRFRLTALRRGGVLVEAYSYDAKDQQLERRFGACTDRRVFSSAGRVISQSMRREGETLVSRAWQYDGRGNVVAIDDRRSGEKRYQFDGDHRLLMSSADGVQTVYGYDDAGNLIGSEGGGRSHTLEYLPGNQLRRSGTSVYERDANGNVIRIVEGGSVTSLSWDVLGQLAEVRLPNGSCMRYAYDGLGRRVRSAGDGTTTGFVWAGEQLLAEVSSDGSIAEYFSSGYDLRTIWRGTTVSHLFTSHHGVPLEAANEWGFLTWAQRLDDWGSREHAEGEADGRIAFRFRGQYADENTGFYYNRFRYYDPRAGQYLSPDPLGLAAGADEYRYCPNPVNWSDPFGLSCGIPPGQHSVYVLESGPPPVPPAIVYVGITVQSPHDRLAQHTGKPPGGFGPNGTVPFDRMRIIASGPNGTPPVPDRTSARLIEASILNNSPQPGQPNALRNAERPVNPGYYHSNIPSAAPPGTTYLPQPATNALLAPGNGTVIT
jgi:RHS repeat-associated protein